MNPKEIRREEGVGPLLPDYVRKRVDRKRLDVRRLGHLGVRHDGGRVRVHEDDLVAFLPERLDGLAPGIVEFASLSDDNRPRSDDQDLLQVSALHIGITKAQTVPTLEKASVRARALREL